MRSPALPADVAATIVATRRSGMHTLGANPAAPDHLLASNPGALRRRAAVDAVAPGGLAEVDADPNRPALLEAASPTVDLVVARSARLDERTAVALASRDDPPVDPWVLAVLLARFGEPVRAAAARAHTRPRLAAADALVDRA